MHQLVIAQQIVHAVLSEMERRGASDVRSIDVEVGELEGLREEEIRRAFRLEAAGTPLESTDLRVSIAPATAFCPSCNAPKPFEFPFTRTHEVTRATCQDCGADLEFQGGRGLVVRRASMVLEDA